eukprot:1980277-Pyramimonas_sp.AAC.1
MAAAYKADKEAKEASGGSPKAKAPTKKRGTAGIISIDDFISKTPKTNQSPTTRGGGTKK